MTEMAVDEQDDSTPTSMSASEAQAAIYQLLELHERFEQAATLMKTVAESDAFETLCEIEEVPEWLTRAAVIAKVAAARVDNQRA